jgi:hypothetical protein
LAFTGPLCWPPPVFVYFLTSQLGAGHSRYFRSPLKPRLEF